MHSFLIFDFVKLEPAALGNGIGLLAFARAIRTWADGIDLVARVAGPMYDEANDPDVRREFGDPKHPVRLASRSRSGAISLRQ